MTFVADQVGRHMARLFGEQSAFTLVRKPQEMEALALALKEKCTTT
jgi:hypothetical protein